MNDVRIDKWLWAARFFKTRGLAQDAIDAGRVLVGEVRIKPSRAVHVGDVITLRTSETPRTVVVQGVSGVTIRFSKSDFRLAVVTISSRGAISA